MAIQSSGPISLADINAELGRSSTAQIGMNEAEAGTYGAINQASTARPNGSTPNSIDEWYNYNHNASAFANISVSNFSLDVDINEIYVDGIAVTHVTGDTFPISTGEGGTFRTTLTGTRNITIYYGASYSGQNINVNDSGTGTQCESVSGNGAANFTFYGATISAAQDVFVLAGDGSC